jgi:hypothetical protein
VKRLRGRHLRSQIATAPCVARTGVTSPDGVVVSAKELYQRVEWLAGITRGIARDILATHWNQSSFDVLNAGVGPDGRKLPSQAAIATRRLGWKVSGPPGIDVPDRVARCGWEQAMRTLKSALHRDTATKVIVESWPDNPEFAKKHKHYRSKMDWERLEQVEASLGVKLDKTTITNRTRAVAKFVREHDRLPSHVTELEDVPYAAAQVVLSPADKQLVELTRISDDSAALRVKLPLVAEPKSRKDWERVLIKFTIGKHVPADAALKLPTLRLKNGKVYIDLPWEQPLPEMLGRTGKAHAGHTKAVAADWGVNTLLTAVTGSIDDTTAINPVVRTDGRVYEFDARGPALKLHRLRVQTEELSAKIDHLTRLIENTPVPRAVDVGRVAQVDQLMAERDFVSARRSNLSREIAWAGASWLVDIAVAQKASVVYVEDLRTMESRGCGKIQNVRMSNQVRGIVLDALRHQAAKHGISVVTVPARGTSKFCPRCLKEVKHVKAPDKLTETGHAWASCGHCGLSANRDHAAAQRILTRGLAAQHLARLDPSKNWRITRVVDVPVRVTRTGRAKHRKAMGLPAPPKTQRAGKRHATAKQFSRPNKRELSGGTPERRTVPAASAPSALVHRPAGLDPREATSVSSQVESTFSQGSHRSRAPSRRARRTAGRGFHPLMHPTFVPAASTRSLPVPNKT